MEAETGMKEGGHAAFQSFLSGTARIYRPKEPETKKEFPEIRKL